MRPGRCCFAAVCLVLWCTPSWADNAPALSAYVGNSPNDLRQFEAWLGRPVDHIAAHSGRADWKDWFGSIKWLIGVWTPSDRPMTWTIPMFANQGSLQQAARGDYKDFYVLAAQLLARSRAKDPVIYVRTGEEFNGAWMPWAAAGHEHEYVAAYRAFVDAFRSVSDRFRFEWNVNFGESTIDPATAYPGDNYVDVVGMDFYYNVKWHSADPLAAWNHVVTHAYGLQWVEDFAAAHHKPTAYPEWGINSDAAGPYIEKAAKWFSVHNVLYQALWNANDPQYRGKLSDEQYPDAGAAYLASFRAPHAQGWRFPR